MFSISFAPGQHRCSFLAAKVKFEARFQKSERYTGWFNTEKKNHKAEQKNKKIKYLGGEMKQCFHQRQEAAGSVSQQFFPRAKYKINDVLLQFSGFGLC